MDGMTETEFRQLLEEVLETLEPEEFPEFDELRTQSFEQGGILTRNEGLVVRLTTGEEFQITIVRSR